MGHMLKENLGLIFHKREELLIPYSHFLATAEMVEHGCLSSKTTCYLAPLYLYPDTEKKDLFSHKKRLDEREPNISPEFFAALSEAYKREASPEEIFCYIYAVFYSNIYRTKYAEFLKIDFPRIPLTKDCKVFSKMHRYGKRLVDLHLFRSKNLDPPVAKFQGKGDNKVQKIKYDKEKKRVYINQNQYFAGITKEIWQYQIGGYQVCNKWLKDRKRRTLSLDDIKHYCKIVTSLQKTIEIQQEIDNTYPEVEKETVSFENRQKL